MSAFDLALQSETTLIHWIQSNDPQKHDPNGNAILHEAAALCDVEAVRLLLAAGANPNVLNRTQTLPIHLAAQGGGAAVLQELIRAGSNVDYQNNLGFSSLHCAAREGSPLCVDLLLQAQADPNLLDNEGNTPLSWALLMRDDVSVQLLREAGGMKGESSLKIKTNERASQTRIQKPKRFHDVENAI